MQSNSPHQDKFEHVTCTYFFSWTPVFIGALVGLGLGFLLDLFGMGIGLSSYTTNAQGAMVLATGGFLGLLVGSIAIMFTSGFAAGFFAGPTCGKRNFGVVYGFVAWCLSLLLMAIFTSHVANYIHSKTPTAMSSSPTSAEVATTTKTVTNRLHPATDKMDTQSEKNVRAVGMISLSMFILFFVGALSACFGGYSGLSCWYKHVERDRTGRF